MKNNRFGAKLVVSPRGGDCAVPHGVCYRAAVVPALIRARLLQNSFYCPSNPVWGMLSIYLIRGSR